MTAVLVDPTAFFRDVGDGLVATGYFAPPRFFALPRTVRFLRDSRVQRCVRVHMLCVFVPCVCVLCVCVYVYVYA